MEILNQPVSEKLSSVSTSSISSSKSTPRALGNKQTVNFIEKNKKNLAKKNQSNVKNRPKATNNNNSELQIKCLNDDDNLTAELKVINDEQEISIISSQSSIDTDNRVTRDVGSKSQEIMKTHENCDKLRSLLFDKQTNRPDESSTNLIENEHDLDDLTTNLVQGNVNDSIKPTHHANMYPNADDDVNILKFDQEKSKIRSDLMRRHASVQHRFKKEIIPNLVDAYDDYDSFKEDINLKRTTTTSSTSGVGSYTTTSSSLSHTCTNVNENLTTAASIAASIATLNAINQPFVKMQTELETKISTIIKKLEDLRKNEENLADKYIDKKKKSETHSDASNDEDSCFYEKTSSSSGSTRPSRSKKSDRSRDSSESRIKHLERVQESQIQLMSQLLSLIDKEKGQQNPNNKFELNEPMLVEQPNNVQTKPFKLTNNTTRPKKKQAKTSLSPTKSRSRSRPISRENKHDRARSSSNQSRCSVCDMGRRANSANRRRRTSSSPKSNCLHKSHASPNRKKKKPEFLEQLLNDQAEPPKAETFNADNKSSIFASTLNDEKPNDATLFDKYLTEAKQIGKQLSEDDDSRKKQIELTEKNLNELSHQKRKSSMFSDIKETLKAVEYTKNQLESNTSKLMRDRNNKMFYELNSLRDEENERLRMRKLVDGCVNAISNDVKKIVSQKLIDESKHAKLEAERDQPIKGRKQAVAKTENQPVLTKKPANVSNVRKYLSNIYGKEFLDLIKSEELEEKNRILREETERRKQQMELDKQRRLQQQQQQQKHQSRILTSKKSIDRANSRENLKSQISHKRPSIDPKRPAFVTITEPYQSYPENKLKSFELMHQAAEFHNLNKADKGNVAVVTVIPRQGSSSRSTSRDGKQLKRQNLPSMSIDSKTKGSRSPKRVNTKVVEIKADEDSDENENSEIDRNLTGTGIQIKGERPNQTDDLNRLKESIESKTLDWLEREILAYFLKNQSSAQTDEETDVKYSDLLETIGRTLHVDMGQPIDPNLIEALCFEVLDEKISSMIHNKDFYGEELYPSEQQTSQTNGIPKPIPSPRKSIVDFLELQRDRPVEIQVATPVVTPSQSPPRMSPVPEVKPQQSEKCLQTDIIQMVRYDSDESLLEIDFSSDENNQDNERQENTITIDVPPTPKETPAPSPEPPQTPDASFVASEPAEPPPAAIKHYSSISVQCDPEPTPPPIIIKVPEQPPKPPSVKSESTVSSDSELTESSTYTSEQSSTTIASEKSDKESDSYFSDGAWLISKSEGQIIPVESNAYVNLDLNNAMRSLMLNPNKNEKPPKNLLGENLNGYESQSDGELNLLKVNSKDMLSYGTKSNPGTNRIIRQLESGEVAAKAVAFPAGPTSVLKQSNERSEGEIENPVIGLINKQKELVESGIKNLSKSSHSSHKSNKSKKKSDDKKLVNLQSSPQKSSKNKIRVQPIRPNEDLVRDSDDFERKIFSSTPDTSMYYSQHQQQRASNSNMVSDEFLDEQNIDDEEDEQEVSLNADESPREHLKPTAKSVNRNGPHKPIVSSDVYTDKDEDSFISESNANN